MITTTRLNIGGTFAHPDYEIVNIQPGDDVAHVWDARNLKCETNSVDEIYASHILEHLNYQGDLQLALQEWHRVLIPGGLLRVSVPHLPTLCELYLRTRGNDRQHIMRIIYGGQVDEYDYHKCGFDFGNLACYLDLAGFVDIRQVETFSKFTDSSELKIANRPISLNLEAKKNDRHEN